jgi:hypothetical protein
MNEKYQKFLIVGNLQKSIAEKHLDAFLRAANYARENSN